MRYAIVLGVDVVNVILWDGEEPYMPPENCVVVSVPQEVSVGWTYVDGNFYPPPSV